MNEFPPRDWAKMLDDSPKKITISAVIAPSTHPSGMSTGFGVKLETPMTGEMAWNMLVGGLVAIFRHSLESAIDSDEFFERTGEKLAQMLEATERRDTTVLN